jgi:hypothetical protein
MVGGVFVLPRFSRIIVRWAECIQTMTKERIETIEARSSRQSIIIAKKMPWARKKLLGEDEEEGC